MHELDTRRDDRRCQERSNKRHRSWRHHRSPSPPTSRWVFSESGIKVRLLGNKRYQKAIDYCAYRCIYKTQRYDDVLASKIQKMHEKNAVQMKYQAFNVKNSNSIINFLTVFKRACNSYCIQKNPPFFSFENLWVVPPLLLSKRSWRGCRNTQTGIRTPSKAAGAVKHLLGLYSTEGVIAKKNGMMYNFK